MSEEKNDDVFDKARDVAGSVGGFIGRAASAVGGAVGGIKERFDGPDTFPEALDGVVAAFRNKGIRDRDIITFLRAKASELDGD